MRCRTASSRRQCGLCVHRFRLFILIWSNKCEFKLYYSVVDYRVYICSYIWTCIYSAGVPVLQIPFQLCVLYRMGLCCMWMRFQEGMRPGSGKRIAIAHFGEWMCKQHAWRIISRLFLPANLCRFAWCGWLTI